MWAWLGINKWAIWLGSALAFLVAWNVWLKTRDERIRRDRDRYWRERWTAAQVETDRRATQARVQSTQEEATRADQALTASQPSGDFGSGRLPGRAFRAPE